MSLSQATADTLAALDAEDADAAAHELARRYARALDAAEVQARQAGEVLARLSKDADPDAYEALEALRAQLSEQQALVQVGKNLHALLVDLRAVPKARPDKPTGPAPNPVLAQMRAAAAGGPGLRAV